MAKIDFNTPVVNFSGEEEKRVIVNRDKIKISPDGRMIPDAVLDADGYAALETIPVGEVLAKILNTVQQGDDSLPYDVRAKRGKLARKVSDRTGSSRKNYTVDELKMIQEQAAKLGSTELLAQLDDLINGENEKESEAA